MKTLIRYLKVIAGCLIISLAFNLFFYDFEIFSIGAFGVSELLTLKGCMPFYESMLIINVFLLLLGLITIDKKSLLKSVLPSFLIPLFLYLTSNISALIDISSADKLLLALFGGVIAGFGFNLIHKSDLLSGANDIIERVCYAIIGPNGKNFMYVFDLLIIVLALVNFGVVSAMYSAVAIIVMEIMIARSTIGVSNDKVFYIITKDDLKVKKFIMNELHYDLTIFDVKGGYLKNKSKVLMTAIPTKDYYKLKEGIKNIDPHAFITITDSYETINNNVSINK